MKKLFFALWEQLEEKRKRSLFFLLFLMIISTLAELLSLAMLLPFMSIILEPNKFKKNEYVRDTFEHLDLNIEHDFLLYITMLFILITFISAIARYTLLVYNARFTFSTSSEIAVRIYTKILSQSFENHISLNSSSVIAGITQKVNSTIYAGIYPLLTLITSFVVSISIITFLLFLDVKVVLSSIMMFSMVYLLIVLLLKKRISAISRIFPEKSTLALKTLQEGLGNIRDIIVDKVQKVYIDKFSKLDIEYKNAQRDSMIFAGVPKIIIESLLMMSIAYVLFYFSSNDIDFIELLPIFSVFIISAQKLLPLIQTIYSSYTSIMSSKHSILDVLELLEIDSSLEFRNKERIYFDDEIKLNNITFSYNNTKINTLENFSLTIKKGEKLGVVGETGSGKSTLIDILMGLLILQKGDFFIDTTKITLDKISSWQNNIAHVPQAIYLSDSTIYENIGFGIDYEKIEKGKVKNIIKKVGLEKLVNDLPDGMDTIVGERGAKLSGGQRQRIGIARALYKNANVLFLDEATSALDNKVEKSIMDVIDNLENMTIIIIAHRISTLSICDRIIELDKGKIIKECTYAELL